MGWSLSEIQRNTVTEDAFDSYPAAVMDMVSGKKLWAWAKVSGII